MFYWKIDIRTFLSFLATGVLGILLTLVLFEPGLEYRIEAPVLSADDPAFLKLLSSMIDKPFRHIQTIDVLRDGVEFYPAELDAICGAKSSINLEAFIFHDTPIGKRFVNALTERARAGVKVRVIVDAVGSFPTSDRFFSDLRAAGGKVMWYQPFRWATLKRLNNRTHRELLIVDGSQAFIGGAGIGSAWDTGTTPSPPWRDTVVRFEGAAVAGLETVFVENWLESSGEILVEKAPVRLLDVENTSSQPTDSGGFVVGSTPVGGRATRAHILLQVLIAAARKNIRINSPYFLPDRALRRELLAAVARGVHVTVIVPGSFNNHPLTRYASRRHYGQLIAGGVQIYEYQPGMIHAKILLIDAVWSVVGSTNFDTRSLGLNDEVNLAVKDADLNRRLAGNFAKDLADSQLVQLAQWKRRPWSERVLGMLSSFFEREE